MSACTCGFYQGFLYINGGYCMYCRVSKQMDDIGRLKLEYTRSPFSFFITWTYADEWLPFLCGYNTLWRDDLTAAIKRLRRYLDPHVIRVFAVGEYGGRLFGNPIASRLIHPHYHLMIFCESDINTVIRKAAESAWWMGHTHILLSSSNLMSYITGYVTKKMTNEKSVSLITGGLPISPEFRLKTNVGDISDKLLEIQELYGEITQLQYGLKKVPVPRFVRHKVRKKLLTWDLNLKTEEGRLEYEVRKKAEAKERLQKLSQELCAQENEIAAQMNKEVYKARREVRRQKIINWDAKLELRKHSKGKKVL